MKKFLGYEDIEKELNGKKYFYDSYCTWQKVINENVNELLRKLYPKRMNLSDA